MKWILNLIMLISLMSCFGGPKTPKDLLEDILLKRQKNQLSKEYMVSVTAGTLQEEINTLSDEEYNSYQSKFGVGASHYKVLSENCETETSCTLTYILSYKSVEEGENVFSSEIKKAAKLEKKEGEWKLMDMSNIKTFHEGLEPINPIIEEVP